MDEHAPHPKTREASIEDIIEIGTEILDHDPASSDINIHEDPVPAGEPGKYRATLVPEINNTEVIGPKPGIEDAAVRLIVIPEALKDPSLSDSPYVSFWADGTVGKRNHDAFREGAKGAAMLDPVDDAELAEVARQLSDAREAFLNRLGSDASA